MKEKTNNQLLSELRDDYIKSKGRIEKLKWEQRYFLTNFNVHELYEVEHFVALIDAIVDMLPEGQKALTKETILKDTPVKIAADDLGYHYTWALELRRKASTNILAAIYGRDLVTGQLGEHLLKEVTYVLTKSNNWNIDNDSGSKRNELDPHHN